MSQCMTVRRRLPESEGSDPVCLSLQGEACSLFETRWRQLLATFSASLTMVVVGTINGWTAISLVYLKYGSGDEPPTLTHSVSSWMVSLIVLGTVIGSLVAAPLADIGGRKYCLIVCSTMFTVGWFIMYVEISVPILYLAQVILGIGVGIAYTINPMYVSEIADINVRGALGTVIALNVSNGSLLTYTLRLVLSYKSLVTVFVIISFMSLVSNTFFPETPYFLLANGRKQQARKSIAYYNGIVDPQSVKFELRALRAEIRYRLHPLSRYELRQQSRSDSPSQSRSDLPPQSRSDLPSQSIREAHSDSSREVVDTEHMSDLRLPSSSDSQSISAVLSEAASEVHQQLTGKLRLQHSCDSLELLLQSSRELHSQSTSELHRPSTSELHQPSTSKIHRSSTSELHRPSTSESHRPSTSELHRPSTRKIHRSSTSELHRPSTSELHRPSTRKIHRSSTSELHRPSTSKIHRPSTSAIHPEPTSEVHQPSTSEIHPEPTSEIHPESTSEIHPPSTIEKHPDIISEKHSRSSSDFGTQLNVDSRESSDIDETYLDETKYNCSTKLRAILQRSNRKALLIMLGLIMARHLSGNSMTTKYLEVLFHKKIGIASNVATLFVLAIGSMSCSLSTLTVEFVGRRKLLILSTSGLCFTLSILATYHFLVELKFNFTYLHFLPVIDLIINQVVFQVGLGTLPTVLLCELFPTKLRSYVGAIIVIFDGILGFAVPKLHQVISDNIISYANYPIYAIPCYLGFMMVYIWIPETKGKTYHEIEEILVGKNLNSSNEEVRSDEMDIHRI